MDEKLFEKLDQIAERITSIEIHLAEYNAQLVYHIDRTDKLEELVLSQADEIKPLIAQHERIKGAKELIKLVGKIVGITSGIIGAITYWFRH